MKRWLTSGLERVVTRSLERRLRESPQLASLAAGVGRVNAIMNAGRLGASAPLRDAEFKVFSQFGDDGIIQHLLRLVDLRAGEERFIEFGVEDYLESNTRFLLVNDNWRGLVLDGSARNIDYIRGHELHWRYDLTAVQAFIDAANINGLIRDAGMAGSIGLLSVDIDGNDYWVWKAIDCVEPVIVVSEYNSLMGPERAITVPYDPKFVRSQAHWSRMYYGASLAALCHLADSKGFGLVGCNSAGNNAYFVKRDRMRELRELSPGEAYVESRFREREREDSPHRIRGRERQEAIAGLPVVNVVTGQAERL